MKTFEDLGSSRSQDNALNPFKARFWQHRDCEILGVAFLYDSLLNRGGSAIMDQIRVRNGPFDFPLWIRSRRSVSELKVYIVFVSRVRFVCGGKVVVHIQTCK